MPSGHAYAQGAAHREDLRRQRMVPLRHAGLDADGQGARARAVADVRAAQGQARGLRLPAQLRRVGHQGRRRDRRRFGLGDLRRAATAASRPRSRSSSARSKTHEEVLEIRGAFLQLYREEGWYLERTVHYVGARRPRPRQGEGRSTTPRTASALAERLQLRARRRARSVGRAREGGASTSRQFEPLAAVSGDRMTRLEGRSAASTTSRCSARAASRASARRRHRGVPHRRRPACSRCSTAARTRAARCRRASSSASSVACPLHNWTIGLATAARGARRRLRAAFRCGRRSRRAERRALAALDAWRAPVAVPQRRRGG